MSTTWIQAAARFHFDLRLACPEPLAPPEAVVQWARQEGARIELGLSAEAAARDADCIVTDTWVSMGQEGVEGRKSMFERFRVDKRVMALAKPDAIFMHCLPAHRDEEVAAEVIDGPQSVVWDEAENRLHAQKGILTWCLQ
jgi:ornithine carbamoyltransferase